MLRSRSILLRLTTETGAASFWASSHDVKLLCLQRFIRMYGYGLSYLILVHFLSNLGMTEARIGLFMTLTLLGDVVISFGLTLITDQVGRRRVLAVGCGLMATSGVVFTISSNYWLLLLASVLGVISPSGNEIGPFKAIEESILAQLTVKDARSDIFAWYMLLGTFGAALGTLSCGFMVQALQDHASWTLVAAQRAMFVLYAVAGVTKLVLTLSLSGAVEAERFKQSYELVPADTEEDGLISEDDDDEQRNTNASTHLESPRSAPRPDRKDTWESIRALLPSITPASRAIVVRLLLLFAVDSFASGLASPSWLTFYFTTVRHLSNQVLGTLFLTTNLIATLSNLLALPIARRLGPLKTMVLTHLPSAIFLALVPIPPATPTGTALSMCLLSLRACTQSMDQAPRQAFLSAVVLSSERTAVLGVVNIAKTLSQAGGIGCTGVLAGAGLWTVMFGGAGSLKASYDLMMLWWFQGIKDREEDNHT